MTRDYFGGSIAERYDETSAAMFAPEVVDPVVDVLAGLAGSRAGAGVRDRHGTDRRAVGRPRGRCAGIELSPDMVAQLRAKDGGADLEVAVGSFADTRVDGEFSLVYLVFNTISNLTSQALQVACFRNAAAHLAPGGALRDRGRHPRPAAAPARPDRCRLRHGRRPLGARRVRRRQPGADLPPLRAGRRCLAAQLAAVPLRLPGRVRPHGPARGNDAAGPLERLGPRRRSPASRASTSRSGRSSRPRASCEHTFA